MARKKRSNKKKAPDQRGNLLMQGDQKYSNELSLPMPSSNGLQIKVPGNRRNFKKTNNYWKNVIQDELDDLLYYHDEMMEEEEDADYWYGYDPNNDSRNTTTVVNKNKKDGTDVAEPPTCAICLETGRPLVKLMKNCSHPGACVKCLRIFYIKHGDNVLDFPLYCFDTSCGRVVRDEQLCNKGIMRTDPELMRYRRFKVLAKSYRRAKGLAQYEEIVYCPECNHPTSAAPQRRRQEQEQKENQRLRRYYAQKPTFQMHQCRACRNSFVVDLDNETQLYRESGKFLDLNTIQAVEEISRDKSGKNDGWARCPNCNIIISKGDGCYSMRCACCKVPFNWRNAVSRKIQINNYLKKNIIAGVSLLDLSTVK